MCTSGMKFLRIPVQWPSILCLIKMGDQDVRGGALPPILAGRIYTLLVALQNAIPSAYTTTARK